MPFGAFPPIIHYRNANRRFYPIFDHFLVPDSDCGNSGDQVARKPRPRRVSGRKVCFEAVFIIPELNAVDFSSIFGAVLVIFGYFGSKVTILSARDLGARCASLPHFNMSGRVGTQGTQGYHWARAGGRYQGHLRPFWGACQESDHLVGPSSRAAPRRRTPPRVDSVGPKVNIDIGLGSGPASLQPA